MEEIRRVRMVTINIPVSFIIGGVTSIEAEDIAISFINSKDKKISNFLMEQNDNSDVRKIKVLEIE